MARVPGLFVAIWVVVAAGAVVWSVRAGEPPPGEIDSFLPDDAMHNQAMGILREAFPEQAARTWIAVIIEREQGLKPDDLQWLGEVARQGGRATEGKFVSPANPVLQHRLISPNRKAALALINLSSNFISAGSINAVKKVEQITGQDRPEGLTVEITGPGGIGRDYFKAMQRALDKTTWVTVIAVLTILVFVYRSPVGALSPLVAIGMSVYLAFVLLDVLSRNGLVVSDMERIFAVVLLFGAGVDYALFWIAHYRDHLQEGSSGETSAALATRFAGPAIMASAGTTICGLSTMMSADLIPAQMAGKILPIVLCVSLLAALTFMPAVVRVLGRAMFWPVGANARPTYGQRVIWPRLAMVVGRGPKRVLGFGLVILGAPALAAITIQPRFDSLSQLPPGTSSSRGYEIANEHFPPGMLYPNTVLLRFEGTAPSTDEALDMSRPLGRRLLQMEGVNEVYSLDAPLGRERAAEIQMLQGVLANVGRPFYLSTDPPVLRFEILIDSEPFSFEAMDTIEQAKTLTEEFAGELAEQGQRAEVYLNGLTPYIIGVRDISDTDQIRVMVLASLVIGAIVVVLVRDLPLTVFMVFATWLTYGATLMLTHLFFTGVMGAEGLDYKVRLIVFVIVVAVGQDYNIFLVSRLMQEPPEIDDREAATRAIVRTGSVISSCGLIMAATLGSLWAGELYLLQQTGFALALGILLDTFFVRPILIPSFVLATGRRRHMLRRNGAPRLGGHGS